MPRYRAHLLFRCRDVNQASRRNGWDNPVTKCENLSFVILGLDPRIHLFQLLNGSAVDPRVKPEDGGEERFSVITTSCEGGPPNM